ncbi:metallophosphoesterase [Spirosoma taeanense]|uniref:Metallophosphoesterase n=1 Tax=Spirosoma taeanense TaxID=2735870 RepID=A0A6M5Y5W8_9BACT|nr:metallophosphoesterase [Spirosoma taeanense]QJW88806.1 metallophosphoesterase [Spirosoma taeanense]
MKCLSISDLHGLTVWQQINFDAYDRIIFIGDYTDSYEVNDETIYKNLNDIIQLRQQYPQKVVLLIGNHDAQYLHYPHYGCSGFRMWAQPSLSNLFARHKALFQIAHQEGAYLFTHAGVTNRWLARLLTQTGRQTSTITSDFNVADLLNDVHGQSQSVRDLLFEAGPRRGGSDPFSGPVWADRTETRADYLKGFHQVVGHTPTDDFLTIGDATGSITYTDVLQTKTAFYEFEMPDQVNPDDLLAY